MDLTMIKSLYRQTADFVDREITLGGWIRTMRVSKNFGFIELNDGSFFKNVQIVFEAEKLANYDEVTKLGVGAAIIVKGLLVETPEAKQPFEIKAAEITVEGASTPEYPLQKKRHTVEYLRTIPHLRPRTNLFSAAFRVRSAAAFGMHKFFQENGFVYIHTPVITTTDCEGADMFQVTTLDQEDLPKAEDGSVDYRQDFFQKKVFLSGSGQLQVECTAQAFSKVYTFGPTFRAERSNTPRHASEFWHIEPEMAFADLSDDMDVIEAAVKYVINYVLETCPQDMEFCNQFVDKGLLERLRHVAGSDFARITYTEAIKILEEHNGEFEYKAIWGEDIQTEHERFLAEKHFGHPVFVTDYPKDIKSFYMRQNDDGKTVAATDLMVPGIGELVGASQREERYDVLRDRMLELGMGEEDLYWYLDLRRFGTTVHSGFGIGFDRLVMYLTGISNIRDVLPFPRTTGVAEF